MSQTVGRRYPRDSLRRGQLAPEVSLDAHRQGQLAPEVSRDAHRRGQLAPEVCLSIPYSYQCTFPETYGTISMPKM